MKNILYTFLSALLIISLFGCNSLNTNNSTPLPNPKTSINSATNNVKSITEDVKIVKKDIEDITKDLGKSTESIKTSAKDGKAKTNITNQLDLNPIWDSILFQVSIQEALIEKLTKDSELLTAVQEKLVKTTSDLTTANNDVTKLTEAVKVEQGKNKTLTDENAKLQDKLDNELRNKFIWISIICFAGLVGCIVLISSGQKIGYIGAVGCGAGLAISIFLVQTFAFIPWIVGGIFVISGIVGIWLFWKKNKAITEIVRTQEIAKQSLSDADRIKIYGDKITPGIAYTVQSESTEDIVAKVRKTLGEKAKQFIQTDTVLTKAAKVEKEKAGNSAK